MNEPQHREMYLGCVFRNVYLEMYSVGTLEIHLIYQKMKGLNKEF